MNKLGVHALVWVGSWSERLHHGHPELGRARLRLIEIPLLNPYGFPVPFTRAKYLEDHELGATASLGLSAAPTSRARTRRR